MSAKYFFEASLAAACSMSVRYYHTYIQRYYGIFSRLEIIGTTETYLREECRNSSPPLFFLQGTFSRNIKVELFPSLFQYTE